MLPLKDKWIVITRPKNQAGNLKSMLEHAGANILLFPLLEINQVDDLLMMQESLSSLSSYDLAVFISPNAVKYTLANIDVEAFKSVKVAAVGKKTKSLLEQHGLAVDFYPKGVSSSEEFLAMADMLEFTSGKNIVILRGNGGRDLIRNTLLKKSTSVDYIEVYKRKFPHKGIEVLTEHYYRNELDILLISSGNALTNLFDFILDNAWLTEVSLLLGSKRIRQKALDVPEHLGELFYTQDPSDDAVYKKLLEWAQMETSNG